MRRWNGWGDDNTHLGLSEESGKLLEALVGPGRKIPDCPRDKLIQKVPPSRLPAHPQIQTDPGIRVDHAHGQSLPDWVALRFGTLDRFPDGVATPASQEELHELLAFAWKQGFVVIPYGGGTSVVGQLQVPSSNAPVLSVSLARLDRLLSLDPCSLLATFEAGARGPRVEAQLQEQGYTLGHFPQSFEYASLGGEVVTRSCGQQSLHYGRIDQLFAGGEVITPRGLLYLPPFPASSAGPDLRQIVLGSEGRLGVVSKVIVRISALPSEDEFHGVFFPSWDSALDAVRAFASANLPLSMVRLSNPQETDTTLALAGHPNKIAWLRTYLGLRGVSAASGCLALVGVLGSRGSCRSARRELRRMIGRARGVWIGRALGANWKKNRFLGPYLRNTLWDQGYAVDTLETSVTWDKARSASHAIEDALRASFSTSGSLVHVFSHISSIYSTGCSIYTTYLFPLGATAEETLARARAGKHAASREIVAQQGTISHQHGVGVDHLPYLLAEKGALGMSLIARICLHLDPQRQMNPQTLVQGE